MAGAQTSAAPQDSSHDLHSTYMPAVRADRGYAAGEPKRPQDEEVTGPGRHTQRRALSGGGLTVGGLADSDHETISLSGFKPSHPSNQAVLTTGLQLGHDKVTV